MSIKKSCVYIVTAKNILCLDLGSKFGWCVLCDGIIVDHGAVDLAKLAKSFGVNGEKCFFDWLLRTIDHYTIDYIVYEDVVAHTGVYAAHKYGGYKAILYVIFPKEKLLGVNVKKIKKTLCGNGNATKHHVIQYVFSELDIVVTDHNESDAIAIAYYVQKTFANRIS